AGNERRAQSAGAAGGGYGHLGRGPGARRAHLVGRNGSKFWTRARDVRAHGGGVLESGPSRRLAGPPVRGTRVARREPRLVRQVSRRLARWQRALGRRKR